MKMEEYWDYRYLFLIQLYLLIPSLLIALLLKTTKIVRREVVYRGMKEHFDTFESVTLAALSSPSLSILMVGTYLKTISKILKVSWYLVLI